jgi:hypothetical protein
LDIVTTRGDQQVAILRNEGKGVFSAPSGFKTVVEPCNIGAADFDGDGNLDLAVGSMANLPTGNLAVHRNVGGGSLSEPDIHDLGGKVWGVTAADLDGDGRPDLVATLDLFPQVPILWNDTKGGFLEKTSVSLTSTVDSSAAADFDTDGDLDLAVAGGGGYAGILENAGERRLEPAVRLEVGRSPRWVVAQDFDGDGAVDLAVLNQDSNDLTVLRNDGRGMFGAGRTTPLSSWWRPRFLQKP